MLLVIDIGNTNLVIGVFDGEELKGSWRLATDLKITSDQYGLALKNLLNINGLDPDDLEDIIIASVVPKLSHTIPRACQKYFSIDPMIVGVGTKTGLDIKYKNPHQLGADRIVNSVAALNYYKRPLIVIDMGTAITFDVIDKKGAYRGGAIAPGILTASDSLFSSTSQLASVELEYPDHAIGRTTDECLQSGIVRGYIAMIDGIIEDLASELNMDVEDVNVVATGGFIRLVLKRSKYIDKIDTDLTLKGLKIIYDKNK